jgi:hypothetical protein
MWPRNPKGYAAGAAIYRLWQRQEALKQVKKGYTLDSIALDIGCHMSTLCRWIKQHKNEEVSVPGIGLLPTKKRGNWKINRRIRK